MMSINPGSKRYAISVVIPTYQRCAGLQELLHALTAQTLPPEQYEVIVTIDGSTDGTQAMAEQFTAPYALRVQWQPNQGRAAACNAGIQAATGDVIVLLDDDMLPIPEFLAAHQAAHRANTRLGVVGAVPVHLEETASPVAHYIGSKFNQHLEKLAQSGYQFKLRDFYSGNFSVRRDLLWEVGSFDPAFTIYGNEDLELYVRLQQAGVQVVYSPNALAYQRYTKDFPALARDNIAKGQTAVLLAAKHPATFAELKLNSYAQASAKWRLLRTGLLRLSALWPGMPTTLMGLIRLLERQRPPRLALYYTLALDYFYWVGVQSARRKQTGAGQSEATLTGFVERSLR